MQRPSPSPLQPTSAPWRAPERVPARLDPAGPAPGCAAPAAPGPDALDRRRWARFPLAEELERVERRRATLWRLPLRASLLLLLVHLFAFNLSVVRGSSMAPGIHDGDRILIDQVSYLFGGVARGDVVVLRYPLDPRLDYIKRVVGLPGDRVSIFDGRVYVNGERVPEPYVERQDPTTCLSTRVLPGHYFVLGDNRPHSSDSREFGQVPAAYVRGRVDLRVWPPARIGRID